MKTFFKNLFITGLLIIVVFSLFNIPSARAEGEEEMSKNEVLCKSVKEYLIGKGIVQNSNCDIPFIYGSGDPCFTRIGYEIVRNSTACGPFSETDLKELRTLCKEMPDCIVVEQKTIDEVENHLCKERYQENDRALRGVCDAFSNDEALNILREVLEAIEEAPGQVNFIGLMDSYQSGREAPIDMEETDDCLKDYADLNLFSSLSPGRMIRGFFAAIAIGARGIVGLVAEGLIKSFTVLPQKLGGYVHFGPISNPDTGIWKMMQIYANFGIIIMMIFMAVATILGIEKYSYKKMLWKLLLVALLINFSLIICGMLVDVSNFLSYHFLSNSANGNLGSTIKGVITKTSCAIAGPDFGAFVPTMIGVAVAIVLSAIFLFQFAGLLFYIISRIITIWICLAVSPLAFLGMAIDAEPVKKAVTMWRDKFTQALVALPILSFTLYFVLIILTGIATQINGISGDDEFGFVMLIAYSVVVIALAQVLRVVANSIGVKQIEQGYAFAQKAVKGIAMAGAAAVGGAALTGITKSKAYEKVGMGLTKAPILNKAGYAMLEQHDKAIQFTDVKKNEKDMEGHDKDYIMEIASRKAPSMSNKKAYARYAAARNIAIKHGWVDDNILKNINTNDSTLNKKELVTSLPEYFRYGKNNEVERIGSAISTDYAKDAIESLRKFSVADMGKTSHKERIFEQVEAQARTQARSRGENEDAAADRAFEEFNQQLVLNLTAGQKAAFYDNIDPSVRTARKYEERIKKAIEKNEEALKKFNEEVAANRSLAEVLNIKRGESLQDKNKGMQKIGFKA